MSSVAIISRMMNIDLPYQSQWFEYYINLGISHFYIYYMDNHFLEIDKILNYYPKDKVTIKKVLLNKTINPNNIFIMDKFEIKEDYILHIDSDEYLYLNGDNLKTFLNKNKDADLFYFYWYMCPSKKIYINNINDVLKDKNEKKYIIKEHKVLFRNKDFVFIKENPHDIVSFNNKHIRKIMEVPNMLIHISYRGIYDCYYKYMYQRLLNHEDNHLRIRNNKEKIFDINNKRININELPSRICVYLGELNNMNKGEICEIELKIENKSQIEIYGMFDKSDKSLRELFVCRVEEMIELELYKNMMMSDKNIKNNIKNMTLRMNQIIEFSK